MSLAVTTAIHDGIAIVTLDLPGEPVNKITRGVRDEFVTLFDRLERDQNVRAAILVSGKPDTFIAGADIDEFLQLGTASALERLSREGQLLLDSLERLRIPVIAAIHGACLGGGLEAVLACRYRIATDHPKTVLALPEVQLGLIPGGGGTQRLPRLVGLRAALDMILTGKNIRAKKALQMGLIDEMVHPSILRKVAMQRARELADGTRKPVRKSGGIAAFALEGNVAGRSFVLKKARESVLEKTHGQYPAPLAAIEAVAAGYSGGKSHGFSEESRLFGEMGGTDVSKQLVSLFFATTALKKDPGVSSDVKPSEVDRIAILGAGFMGAGIASIAVQQGTMVRLKDADHSRVAKGFSAIRDVIKERLVRKQITRTQFADFMSLVGGTTDYSGFGGVDLVIEAVFEDLAVKHKVLEEVEAVIGNQAIFASNTSTIPIARIAEASRHPERLLGMHFFSPVHKMPLLEVIVTPATLDEVTATVVAYGKKLGKTVIVVNDGPGFYVNRILSPYINEAGRLLDEGTPIEQIDKALVDFGFPVGPITLIDEVGLDVAAKAGKIMSDAFGARLTPPAALARVVEAGRYGRKTKKGFYKYDEAGKKGEPDSDVYALFRTQSAVSQRKGEDIAQVQQITNAEIQQRCVLALLNEAARCLQEGVIRSARDGDVGAVFGFGFPPFRGGPFRYMDSLGAAALVQQLEELNGRFPGRFEPADNLIEMARKGARFHTDIKS